MNFLLDTDTCSAHLKRPAGLMHRFVQHAGGLCVSTVALGELYTWAYNRKNRTEAVHRIENDLLGRDCAGFRLRLRQSVRPGASPIAPGRHLGQPA
jgi:predicted nucleic acid-binding protein